MYGFRGALLAGLVACKTATETAMGTTPDSLDDPVPTCTPGPPDNRDPLFGQACGRYEDPPVTVDIDPVLVRLENQTAEALVLVDPLDGCHHDLRFFEVEGVAGGRRMYAPETNCPTDWPTCSTVMHGPAGCHLCDSIWRPILLVPGGHVDMFWNGIVLAEATLEARCAPDGDAHLCTVPMRAPFGEYTVHASSTRIETCPAAGWGCVEDLEDALEGEATCFLEYPAAFESCDPGPVAAATWDGRCGTVHLVFAEPD